MSEGRIPAAHIRKDAENKSAIEVQSVEEHCVSVANLAAKYASVFGLSEAALRCGEAHDLGKYSEAFQKRIWENGPKTDHSTRGMAALLSANARHDADLSTRHKIFALRNYNDVGVMAAYCVAGHHGGLPDGGDRTASSGTLTGRFRKDIDRLGVGESGSKFIQHDEKTLQILSTPHLCETENEAFRFAFATRMLFSCLVDADYLDTERFMNGEQNVREFQYNVPSLWEKLDQYLDEKGFRAEDKSISENNPYQQLSKQSLNAARSRILERCIEFGADSKRGLYSLTVPTGGGKTISSLAFALNHAINNEMSCETFSLQRHGDSPESETLNRKMERIIYVIPYCSIIDQTVEKFQEILGKDQVLAHYSEAKYDDKENGAESLQYNYKKLACENWDAPVIVTSAVQFFESLFSNRPSACRKLHRMANSVIIFDEAQTIPVNFLRPCVAAISELTLNYNSTCVLCTATQPSLGDIIKEYAPKLSVTEICSEGWQEFPVFKRVNYKQLGRVTNDELVEKLQGFDRVLCIVSTRKHAKDLYEMMPKEGTYHLSTLMVPKHRQAVLREIKERLKKGKVCRVISTSLIEAGVDIDFPIVFRAYAGLDSMIQAAGRCNRENLLPPSEAVVYLFQPEAKYDSLPASLTVPRDVAKSCIERVDDIDTPKVISNFFQNLYRFKGEGLDWLGIMEMLSENFDRNRRIDFPEIAKIFKIIDNLGWTVFVPLDGESRRLESLLTSDDVHLTKEDFRKIGPYCVSIFDSDYEKLKGSLNIVNDKFAVLYNLELYDENSGLAFDDLGGYGLIEG